MAITVQVEGTQRTETGKGAARKIRATAHVPGILYGRGTPPLMFQLNSRDFTRALHGHAASTLIVDFVMKGQGEVSKALIREIQVDPLTGELLHVDLNRISLTEKLEIEVPVELVGLAAGVKNFGGILQHPVRTLSIRCFADKIPEKVTIDVSHLGIHDAIKVRDLSLPDIEIVSDMDVTLASVLPPAQEEVAKPVAAATAEPEVIGKKEEAAEGEEKEAGGKKEEKKEKK